MWELACLRCGRLGVTGDRVDAIAGKPAPTVDPFTREIELSNNKPAHRPLLHRIALAAPANN
ncbi:hypothetical protein PFLL34_04458 [Pseudomonas fluorescens]|nr:hypothetical protein PFLL34_04458 [Pseudomonas fluorescens]SFX37186.1 hypothetical protein SAMN03159398_01463 [Pseudomonas sp. NFPP02]